MYAKERARSEHVRHRVGNETQTQEKVKMKRLKEFALNLLRSLLNNFDSVTKTVIMYVKRKLFIFHCCVL